MDRSTEPDDEDDEDSEEEDSSDEVASLWSRVGWGAVSRGVLVRVGVVLVLLAVGAGGGWWGWTWWQGRPPGDVTRRVALSAGSVTELVFSNAGTTLAVGTARGSVVFLTRADWSTRGESAITTQPLTAMVSTRDGHLLASTLGERLLLWDWKELGSRVMPGLPAPPTALATHPETSEIVVGLATGGLWRLDVATGASRVEERGHGGAVTGLQFGPRGAWLASTDATGELRVTWADPQREAVTRREHTSQISSLAQSASGKIVATADWSGAVLLWNPASWTVERRLDGANSAISRLVATETRLFAGGWSGEVVVWKAPSGEVERRVVCGYAVQALAVSADESLLVTGGEGRFVDVRELGGAAK
jgi:WD40 repeat protein